MNRKCRAEGSLDIYLWLLWIGNSDRSRIPKLKSCRVLEPRFMAFLDFSELPWSPVPSQLNHIRRMIIIRTHPHMLPLPEKTDSHKYVMRMFVRCSSGIIKFIVGERVSGPPHLDVSWICRCLPKSTHYVLNLYPLASPATHVRNQIRQISLVVVVCSTQPDCCAARQEQDTSAVSSPPLSLLPWRRRSRRRNGWPGLISSNVCLIVCDHQHQILGDYIIIVRKEQHYIL